MPWQLETRLRVGRTLKALRSKTGLSAAEVADYALGYPPKTHVAVSRLERGILSDPPRSHLLALAKFYEVSVFDIASLAEMGQLSEQRALNEREVHRQEARQEQRMVQCPVNLQRILEVKKWTPEKAAALTGFEISQIEEWLQGNSLPSFRQARALAALGDTTEYWLLNGRPI